MSVHDEFPVQVIDVPPEEHHEEQSGTKAKFWFEREKEWVLFKFGRENEDWSEKAGTDLARLLGVPCAQVHLAEWNGKPGIISPSLLQTGDRLIHGNQLLLRLDPSYPDQESYHVRQHTVDAVMNALEESHVLACAAGDSLLLPESFDGQDVFVGYLLLDAWIGNSDRHHENWAVIQRRDNLAICPSYDHASSLGRNEPAAKIEVRLRGTDSRSTAESYAAKCRSALYETHTDTRPMTTYEAFAFAMKRRAAAAAYWLSRLQAIDDESVSRLLDRIPGTRCSNQHRTFAHRILEANRRRLLAL